MTEVITYASLRDGRLPAGQMVAKGNVKTELEAKVWAILQHAARVYWVESNKTAYILIEDIHDGK